MTDNVVVCRDGKRVPEFTVNPSKFMDKTIVLYGKSNSGKTTLVKFILHTLKDKVPIAFVVSPTEPSNKAYEDFIDRTMIHYDLVIDNKHEDQCFLYCLWSWQSLRAGIYNKVKRLDILKTLYGRYPDSATDTMLSKVKQKKESLVRSAHPSKKTDIEGQCDELTLQIYRNYINKNKSRLNAIKDQLTEDEKYSLKYINLNPRIVIIFDDCSAELKPYFNRPMFRKLFYQSRHSYITPIFTMQDDSDLSPNLRKNVAINIFTQGIVAASNFTRASNKFSKDVINYANSIIADVFVGHRKLIYVENDSNKQHFYWFTAKQVAPFKFGSSTLNELCRLVKSEGGALDSTNPYMSKFKV